MPQGALKQLPATTFNKPDGSLLRTLITTVFPAAKAGVTFHVNSVRKLTQHHDDQTATEGHVS
jgi:hypothetical protein